MNGRTAPSGFLHKQLDVTEGIRAVDLPCVLGKNVATQPGIGGSGRFLGRRHTTGLCQLPNYLQQLAGTDFGLLNRLNDLRAEYEEGCFRRVLASAAPEEGQAATVLALTGPLGSTASASLRAANTSDERATVRYLVSDVRRADGVGPAFDPKISIVPDTLELEPEEEGL